MNRKGIRTHLKSKIDSWLASIEDETVRKLAARNTIVTGGAIASMLLGEKINDYDLYFRDQATAYAVARYYIKRFKPASRKGIACAISVISETDRVKIVIQSAGIASETGDKPYEYFEARPENEAEAFVGEVLQDAGTIEETCEETEQASLDTGEKEKDYRPIFMSTNAITLSGRVQVILRFFGEPDEIHKNYDFVHCTNYWDAHDGELTLRPAALEALLTKELIYVGSKYPVCSLFRLRKFIRRGWKINAGQILKAVMQINELDLTNIEVLQDQLTGVDCAYFMEVVNKLKQADPVKVNAAYLVEIIDRMF